ncbi:MAG: S-layer homology domain-containing protein [Clostridiales bacterium]|nr:S-layer homology domain-containing protein [Clostridiales bacterium]
MRLLYTDEDAFSDISGHWANVYINSAYAKGWVAGYDGKYNPDTAITRAEAMTLINNVLGREVDADGLHEDAKQWPDNLEYAWYYYEVLEATNYHEYVIDDDGDEVWTDILPNKTWNEGAA